MEISWRFSPIFLIVKALIPNLGEEVTMSGHMLQAAQNAERASESNAIIAAAMLHDI